MREPKVHIEWPMLSKKMLCGRRLKDIKAYVWMESHMVTCKRCLAALPERKKI